MTDQSVAAQSDWEFTGSLFIGSSILPQICLFIISVLSSSVCFRQYHTSLFHKTSVLISIIRFFLHAILHCCYKIVLFFCD